MTHEERNIRLASIQTIGYICEEIEEEKQLTQEQREIIISAIINCINGNKDDAEALKCSIQAMFHSLEYTRDIFEMSKGNIIL